jgi:hypothetical protein
MLPWWLYVPSAFQALFETHALAVGGVVVGGVRSGAGDLRVIMRMEGLD